MNYYLDFVHRHAKLILVVLAVITGFFINALGQLTADSNPYLLPESHPARKPILDMQQIFTGTYDAVMIAQLNKKDAFNTASLNAAYHFTRESKKLMLATEADAIKLRSIASQYPSLSADIATMLEDGLQQSDVFKAKEILAESQSISLGLADKSFLRYLPHRLNPIEEMAGIAASENIFVDEYGTLITRPSLRDYNMDPAIVKQEVMGNKMLLNGVVSEDGKIILTVVELGLKQDDAEGQLRAYEAFQSIIGNYRSNNPALEDEVYIAGVPIFFAEQKRLIDHDMAILFPFVIIIVALILIAFFRQFLGIALPLVNVVMCSVWTLGMMAIFGTPLDLITSVLPVFLITICGADAIHIMAEYYSEKKAGRENKEAVNNTMRVMVSPVLLTTVTTVVAFLVSSTTPIEGIRNFGLYMAVGLVTAQIISLLLIPAWISVWGTSSSAVKGSKVKKEWLTESLARTFSLLIANRSKAIVIFFVLLLGAGLSATRINIEDAGAEYFKADNQYRVADEFVNNHVAGTSPGWIMFEAASQDEIFTVETVDFINRLDEFLLSQPNITYTYSLATYVRRIFYVMNDMNPAYERIPEHVETFKELDENNEVFIETVNGNDIIRQSILLYENGGGSDLTNILNSDFSKTTVLFTMNTTRATEYEAALLALDAWIKENKPDTLKVTVAGTPVIWTGVLAEILEGQIVSTLMALFAVFVVVALWLRSVKNAFVTALPLAVTLVFFYGMMPIAGIDLNIGTAIIAFLVVGIVDYAVHFILRIRYGLEKHELELDDAIIYAVKSSGKSIVFNVLVFSLGFLSLVLAEYEPVVHLGILVSASLLLSGIMSLVVISVFAPWLITLPPKIKTAESGPGNTQKIGNKEAIV